MTIELVFPTLPPAIDGIGDYTVRLAQALQQTSLGAFAAGDSPAVRVRTGLSPTDASDVDVVGGYNFSSFASLRRLIDDVCASNADWMVLQYNPFSYGQWGLNLILPAAMWALRRKPNAPRLAVMVHEPFVPAMNWRFALMGTWQRAQFYALGLLADHLFFSIAPWADRFAPWFPSTPLNHLPVGSNMPRVPADPPAIRKGYGIAPETFVMGVFGSAHPSRLLSFVREAVAETRRALPPGQPVCVLYVGIAGEAVRHALDGAAPLVDAGRLDAPDVSRAFAAMDVYCAPFRKGVSTRRGSFMTGLQHGVATLSTQGIHTDACLQHENGRSLVLALDDDPAAYAARAAELAVHPEHRHNIAQAGRHFFEAHFEWSQIARRMVSLLSVHTESQVDARAVLEAAGTPAFPSDRLVSSQSPTSF